MRWAVLFPAEQVLCEVLNPGSTKYYGEGAKRRYSLEGQTLEPLISVVHLNLKSQKEAK